MDASEVVWRRGKKTLLRPYERSDISLFRKWINDQDVNRFLMRTSPLTELAQEKWYETTQVPDPNDIRVTICLLDGTPIGNTALRIDADKQSGTTGTIIGTAEHRGKGYGTDAKMLLLDYAFNWRALRKVTSSIFNFNGQSIRYAEKCGHRHMATIEQEHFRDGQWIDEERYVVFRDDWLPLWKEWQKDL